MLQFRTWLSVLYQYQYKRNSDIQCTKYIQVLSFHSKMTKDKTKIFMPCLEFSLLFNCASKVCVKDNNKLIHFSFLELNQCAILNLSFLYKKKDIFPVEALHFFFNKFAFIYYAGILMTLRYLTTSISNINKSNKQNICH